MTTEYFMQYVYTPAMRQYVVDTARAFTRSRELQEDCCQEAWMAVAQKGEGKTDNYYRAVAYKAMDKLRKKEQRRYKREDNIKAIMAERILAGLPKYGQKKVKIFKKLRKKVE